MPYARQCDHCRQIIEPRGEILPRFCPFCGGRLGGAPVEASQPRPAGYAPGYRAATSGLAIASLVLGILSFIPLLGVPEGLVAVGLGWAAHRRIRRANGALAGRGLATAGMVLATLGLISNFGLFAALA